MKKLIKNGDIVSPGEIFRADVLINGERIERVGENIDCPDAEVIDAAGKLVFPGFIDAHTHFDLEVSDTVTADDFASGTASAIAGGTTCIIDFVSPLMGEPLACALERWHRKADGKCFCDYGFHMSFCGLNDGVLNEIPDMFRAGISTFKAYMTYSGRLTDAELESVVKRVGELGGFVGVHCENGAVIDANVELHASSGRLAPAWHSLSRPAEVESSAIKRVSRIASRLETPVMVVHLSTRLGMELVRRQRYLYAETCPQYLLLDNSKYRLPEHEAQKFICSPPLRTKTDRVALWKALADGSILTVSTDHCSFTPLQKAAGNGDFRKIPNGMPGVQTRPALMYSEGVAAGRISAERMCALLCENPARLYGMFPRKGVVAPGADADIVLWDTQKKSVLSAATQLSAAGYCPYEGLTVVGAPEKVFLRGELAAQNGALSTIRRGAYIHRNMPEVFY